MLAWVLRRRACLRPGAEVRLLRRYGGHGRPRARAARSRSRAGQTIRLHLTRAGMAAGRHRVTLAQLARGMQLAPGTYVLLVRATDSAGQRSNDATVKFFVVTG
jgi:hypothetical protein